MFKLVIQDDEGKTTVVPLIRDEITIGRKEGNTIRLTERNVSRRHARILRNDNEVQIEDLGSYNGIRVNNARIAERVSLRISDQVQIGDYKLYLKAEGVEQVDDARTMPIERIDSPSPEGVTVPAPPPVGATVQPVAAMAAQRVAPMAVADTDPAGRPVATPAQVAALTAPAGYGKFVVLSSNFAGKELQLSRPQMIIGRTDENDLVVNHRSISRNHAKVTRDPETQRYTISDLQSSNGVRVNGQDYGKVELRRADVVDLGHVRMRFVEPGEDFVFARDAVITDVPETGGRRSMLIAVVLAIVVLGGVGAFFVLKGSPGDSPGHGKIDPGGSGTRVATPGSGGSSLALAVDVDAGTMPAIVMGSGDSPELKRFEGDCLGDITDKKWSDLETCADQLDSIKHGSGQQYHNKAKLEIGAQGELENMQGDLRNKNLKSAQKHLEKIPSDSVYNAEALKELTDKRTAITTEAIAHAKLLAKAHDCDKLDRYIAQEGSALGDDVGAAVGAAVKCEAAQVAVAPSTDCSAALLNSRDARCKQQFCATHDTNAACRSAEATPAVSCEALVTQGDTFVAAGDHASALKTYEQAYKCKGDPHTLSLTFMAACNAGNVAHAKTWWKKLPPEQQNRLSVMCIRNRITRDQLDAP